MKRKLEEMKTAGQNEYIEISRNDIYPNPDAMGHLNYYTLNSAEKDDDAGCSIEFIYKPAGKDATIIHMNWLDYEGEREGQPDSKILFNPSTKDIKVESEDFEHQSKMRR